MVSSSDTSEDALVSARLKVCRVLNKWHKTQLNLHLQLADELHVVNGPLVDVAHLEHEKLLLPSDFQ
jgi:hypothetical protein